MSGQFRGPDTDKPQGRRRSPRREDCLLLGLEVRESAQPFSRSSSQDSNASSTHSRGRRRFSALDRVPYLDRIGEPANPPTEPAVRQPPPPMIKKPYRPTRRQVPAAAYPSPIDLVSQGARSPLPHKPEIYRMGQDYAPPSMDLHRVNVKRQFPPAESAVTIGVFAESPRSARLDPAAVQAMLPPRRAATPPRRAVNIITGAIDPLAAGCHHPSPVRQRDPSVTNQMVSPMRNRSSVGMLDWPGA
jgi:hypothetical protein